MLNEITLIGDNYYFFRGICDMQVAFLSYFCKSY